MAFVSFFPGVICRLDPISGHSLLVEYTANFFFNLLVPCHLLKNTQTQ